MAKTAFIQNILLLNYDKCAPETAKTSFTYTRNIFSFRGALPPLKPSTRALPLDPAGALAPDLHIGSRYRARHWHMTTTYFTTTPLERASIANSN